MRKIVMLVLLVLGLAASAAGYYMFYLKPKEAAQNASQNEPLVPPATEYKGKKVVKTQPDVVKTDYYVGSPQLGVREAPDYDAYAETEYYRGDKLIILEQKDGWGRISPYYVYEEGGPEVAEWVPMDALLETPPIISEAERRETITGYINGSDDFDLYEEMFVKTTDKLLQDGTCSPADFEELGGWVTSVKYSDGYVYFVYCGGFKVSNKIYVDVQTGEIFFR
ncbi:MULTISPECIES: hypothetical protein [unclassified Vibrio]|uniref:hypothetical protein n=1 Tax=unclassified Vibrio TaxID=2614977 RepID=UPI001361F0EF|nr:MULTISPECIES: hypothetical protein [unclassified Vibrio]NAW55933.1 hypothetical protein [Vibrio sp. V36_P2S2PM302]NAX26517.1 hypothetical protein [Vibrio sp. V38_P2S17PM301]NAX29141.1 hypothetical protein [Vibrio sp. V37_P2S8PM304]